MFNKIKNFQYYTEIFWIVYALLYIPVLLTNLLTGEYLKVYTSISFIIAGYMLAIDKEKLINTTKKLFIR
jgi:hypothetical protein